MFNPLKRIIIKTTLYHIRDIHQIIRGFELKLQNDHNLSFNEGIALCLLKKGPLSSGELSKRIKLSTSNTSKTIKIIEEKGYVKRLIDATDRRKMFFTLTEMGKNKIVSIKCEEDDMPLELKTLIQNMHKE